MPSLETILFELHCEVADDALPKCATILAWCQRFPEHGDAILRHCIWWYASEMPSALEWLDE